MQYFGFDRPSFGFKTFGFGVSEDEAIKALFAGGKQGVWLDPSDLSTMFKDAAGTQPVTANGDPVGLILDKSQGLVYGTNKIPSTALTTRIAEWYLFKGTLVANSMGATLSSDAYNSNMQWTLDTLVMGQYYEISVDIVSDSQGGGGNSQISLYESTADASTISNVMYVRGLVQTVKLVSKAAATNILRISKGGYGSLTVNNIKVRSLFGNHATQTVSAARPTYNKDATKSWLYHDKVDDKMSVTLPVMTATVVTATDDGVTISYPVVIPSGSYTLTNNSTLGRDYGRLIIDKELSVSEKAQVTTYFNGKRGV